MLTICVPAGVRDYIHVVDLAKGHIAALKKLKENCGCKVSRGPLSGMQPGLGRALPAPRELKGGLALLPSQKQLTHIPSPPPRSTIWAQAAATLSCRWSRPWRKPQGGR